MTVDSVFRRAEDIGFTSVLSTQAAPSALLCDPFFRKPFPPEKRATNGHFQKYQKWAGSMEIIKTEVLLYFDDWIFQPKWTQLTFKCLGLVGAQMTPAADDTMEMTP